MSLDYLSHFGLTAEPFGKDIGDAELWMPPSKLSLVEEYFSYEPYGFMLRRNDSAFRLSVNRVLAGLYRSGDVVPIYEKWFGSMSTAGNLIGAMYLINGLPE